MSMLVWVHTCNTTSARLSETVQHPGPSHVLATRTRHFVDCLFQWSTVFPLNVLCVRGSAHQRLCPRRGWTTPGSHSGCRVRCHRSKGQSLLVLGEGKKTTTEWHSARFTSFTSIQCLKPIFLFQLQIENWFHAWKNRNINVSTVH